MGVAPHDDVDAGLRGDESADAGQVTAREVGMSGQIHLDLSRSEQC